MSNRQFIRGGAGEYGHNREKISFSLVLNGSSDPDLTLAVGAGNLIASATGSATGKLAVVLSEQDFYNAVLFAEAVLEDAASSDGAYATIGNFAHEGTSTPLSFQIATWSAGGSATAYTSRRVFVTLVLRNTNAAGVP